MDELLSEFVAETRESLEALANIVVALESDPSDRALLDELFRFFHTVKGSCGFLDLPRFERLSHAAEDVLAEIRSGDGEPDSDTISAVLAIMDRIADLCSVIEHGEALSDEDDQALIDALRRESGATEAPDIEERPGAPADHPVARATGNGAAPAAPSVAAFAAPAASAEPAAGQGRDANRDADPEAGDDAAVRAPTVARTIRLPILLIDQLMNGVSDMVLARNELARKLRGGTADPELENAFERLSSCIADMRDTISRTRMQRVDRLFMAIPRMVRDLGRDLGKKIEVVIEGGDVEMDREMIEMVVDPLTHIVRNSIDHGIETPAERRAAGKPDAGLLRVSASQSGSQIVIEVSDDGRGVDKDAVAARVVASGIMSAADVARLDAQERLDLIFLPGLSTASRVTAVSGRGVGMDVVRANVERIGGVIALTSEPGRGLTVTLRVPLTLTIIPGLILGAGGLNFAFPRSAVIEILHDSNPAVSVDRLGGGLTATIRGTRYSMIDLEDVIGRPKEERPGPRTLMLVRSASGRPYILGVSQVENHEELVIRPAAPVVMSAGIYAGMTLPDNGHPMLLLDAGGIAQAAHLPLIAETVDALLPQQAEPENAEDQYSGLRFIDLDGVERVIRLALVDRVEDVPVGNFGRVADRSYVTIGGEVIVCAQSVEIAADGAGMAEVTCLRVRDDAREICYPVRSVIDIGTVPERLDIVLRQQLVAGVVVIDGRRIEVIDGLALLALADETGRGGLRPTRCVIADGEDRWNRDILAPLLHQAGYQVVWGAASADEGEPDFGDNAILLLTSGKEGDAVRAGGGPGVDGSESAVPVVRLRRSSVPDGPDDRSIYRYDRVALLDALSALEAPRGEARRGAA